MGGKVTTIAYVAMCIVIAGCALYWTATTTAPPLPVPVDEEAKAKRRQVYEAFEARRREQFREDVTTAVRAAFAEANGVAEAPRKPARKPAGQEAA